MSAEDNKAVVQRFYGATNSRNLDLFDEVCAPDFRGFINDVTGESQDLEAFKRSISELLTTFPDFQHRVVDWTICGDKVATRWIVSGTQVGPMEGIPPTGRRMEVPGMDLFRLANGKIVEVWAVADALDALQQLGIIPRDLGEQIIIAN